MPQLADISQVLTFCAIHVVISGAVRGLILYKAKITPISALFLLINVINYNVSLEFYKKMHTPESINFILFTSEMYNLLAHDKESTFTDRT